MLRECNRMSYLKYILVTLLIVDIGNCQAPADTLQQMRELVTKIENAIPEGYRNPDGFIEGKHWRRSAEFLELQRQMQTQWMLALQHAQQVAPSDTSQTILFVAAQALDRESYIKFMSAAVGLFRNRTIQNNRILVWALMPPDKPLKGFIGDEYQRPEVRAMLQEAKTVFSADTSFADMLPFIDGILSGDVQKRYADFAAQSESTPQPSENVPQPVAVPDGIPTVATPPSFADERATRTVQRRARVLPWVVGIAALAVIVLFVWKRRT